ncbi:MAG: hypothetical protein U9O87_06210, partial [Verrucomicrobiota bacterium]|nr:hypothetical protein [Verrucomicrobiota bacterium]
EDYNQVPSHGYLALSFNIHNTSLSEAKKIEFNLGYRNIARKTIVVPPRSITAMPVYVPATAFRNTHCFFYINNQKMDAFTINRKYSYTNSHTIFAGKKRGYKLQETLNKYGLLEEKTKSGRVKQGNKTSFQVSSLDISNWSDNWLTYGSFDAVVLSYREFTDTTSAVKEALTGYMKCGGTLTIIGGTLPELQKIFPAISQRETNTCTIKKSGFGYCIWIPDDYSNPINKMTLVRIKKHWSSGKNFWKYTEPFSSINNYFPVKGELTVPVKSLSVLMFLFVILVGPINIIILMKIKKRILLLVTVPAISGIFSLILLLFFIFGEGFEKLLRIQSITLLNQDTNHASTLGLASFYSTLSPSKGLIFDNEAEITIQNADTIRRLYSRNPNLNYQMQCGEEQIMHGDFVRAKIPSIFKVRKFVRTKNKIEFIKDGQDILCTNGLGVSVKNLWLFTKEGSTYKMDTEKMEAGDEISLVKCQLERSDYDYSKVSPSYLISILEDPKIKVSSLGNPQKGTYYIAILDDNPFISKALKNADPKNHSNVVIGEGIIFRTKGGN